MDITQSIQKWGNSTGVRLPKKVLEAANLKLDEPLVITIKGGSVVLTPLKKHKKVTLNALLHDVTPGAVGGEHRWGNNTGVEKYDY